MALRQLLRRRRLFPATVCVLTALAAGCAAPVAEAPSGRASGPGRGTGTATETASPSSTVGDGVEALTVGGYPIGLTVVGGRPWAALARSGAVRDGHGDLVDVGRTPLRVLATPDGVWVSVFGAGEVVLVDPATSRVVRRFDGFDEPEGLAAAAGVVWVVDQARGTLTGVAADGTRTAPVAVGHGPRLAAAGASGVAVTSYADGTVTVVDPGTATGRTSPRLCSGPQGVLEHDGSLWVACTSDGSLVQVDPTTLATIRVVPDLPGADAVVAGPVGTVLAVLAEGPTVVAVRTADGSVRSRTELSDAPPVRDGNVDAVLDGARLWVSSPVRGELLAVDLPTLLGPDGTDPP